MTGVDITKAQGHAATSRTRARYNQCRALCTCRAKGTVAVTIAMMRITGRKNGWFLHQLPHHGHGLQICHIVIKELIEFYRNYVPGV